MNQVYSLSNLSTLLNALSLSTQFQLLQNKNSYEQALIAQGAPIICNNIPYMKVEQFKKAVNSTNLTADAKQDIMTNITKITGSQLNTTNCTPITTITQLEKVFNPSASMINSQLSMSSNNGYSSMPLNNGYVIIMNSNTFLNLVQSKGLKI